MTVQAAALGGSFGVDMHTATAIDKLNDPKIDAIGSGPVVADDCTAAYWSVLDLDELRDNFCAWHVVADVLCEGVGFGRAGAIRSGQQGDCNP